MNTQDIKDSKNLNAPSKGNVPALRFPEFSGEWEDTSLDNECTINPISDKLKAEFVYVDLESVEKGELTKMQVIEKGNAPSRAQRVLRNGDILFQCVRPYQKNNYLVRNVASEIQWVASTGYAQLRTDRNNPAFIYHLINTSSFNKKVIVRCTGSSYPAINSDDLSKIHFYICGIEEQKRIADFLSLIDERISIQSRIIEKYETLIKGIVELAFSHAATSNTLGCYITQISQHNKNGKDLPVLSVSNKHGFVEQSEQFEDRIIASDDTSNYKIVSINDFAYNPARINVGSIARLKDKKCGIVSPMYICFRTSKNILPEYLELFFKTVAFSYEVGKRLEGSVRLCLSFESLCEIRIPVISIREQQSLVKIATAFYSKLDVEKGFLRCYQAQKQYLLSQMFI